MAQHPLLVRHRHRSKHIFLCSSDPAPLFSSWLPFVTLKRHCSRSCRWIRECWSSLTREMGDVGHVHAGGMPFSWNSILHLRQTYISGQRGQLGTTKDCGANEKKQGLHTFPQYFPHPPLTVSCSKFFLSNTSWGVTS